MSSSKVTGDNIPSPYFIVSLYGVIAVVLSFAVTHVLPAAFGGRSLSAALPTARELAPLLAVLASFCVYYEAFDITGVGMAKAAHKHVSPQETNPSDLPKPILFASRAQLNQVEQAPFFFVAATGFGLLVSPLIAAVFSAVWVVLRALYSMQYRKHTTAKVIELVKFTVPCYVIVGVLGSATVVHAARLIIDF